MKREDKVRFERAIREMLSGYLSTGADYLNGFVIDQQSNELAACPPVSLPVGQSTAYAHRKTKKDDPFFLEFSYYLIDRVKFQVFGVQRFRFEKKPEKGKSNDLFYRESGSYESFSPSLVELNEILVKLGESKQITPNEFFDQRDNFLRGLFADPKSIFEKTTTGGLFG